MEEGILMLTGGGRGDIYWLVGIFRRASMISVFNHGLVD